MKAVWATVWITLYTLFLAWFFFGPRAAARARSQPGGVQEIDVTVQGGYSPPRIVVRRGVPVRLRFRRLDTSSCAERVIFPDFNVSRVLPVGEVTTVEFTPDCDGTFTFTCGMGMYRGTLVVEAGGGGGSHAH